MEEVVPDLSFRLKTIPLKGVGPFLRDDSLSTTNIKPLEDLIEQLRFVALVDQGVVFVNSGA